jgi:hypothetical protein
VLGGTGSRKRRAQPRYERIQKLQRLGGVHCTKPKRRFFKLFG